MFMDYCIVVTVNVPISLFFAGIIGAIVKNEVWVESQYYTIAASMSALVSPFVLELLKKYVLCTDKWATKEAIVSVLDYIVLFSIGLLVFYHHVSQTTFYLPLDWSFLLRLLKVIPIIVLTKVILNIKEKTMYFAIIAGVVFFFAWPREHYTIQAFYAFLIVGCVGISIRKIFYAAFIPATLVTVNMILASLNGAIYSMASLGRNIRSYWGNCSPTDFATAVLFCVIFLWILFKDIPDEFFFIPTLFSAFISFYVTRSFAAGYGTIIFMFVLGFRILEKRVIEPKGKMRWLVKFVDVFIRIAFPLMGIIVIIAVIAYYKEVPIAKTIDVYFHKRLVYASKMLAEYGVKPFGTYFDMIGNGWSTLPQNKEYTFIDSSYPQILIRYGWITYIAANVLWVYMADKAIRTGNRRLAFALAMLPINFVMEHHFFEISYDPFVLMPFADFGTVIAKENKVTATIKRKFCDRKYAVAFTGSALACMGIIFLLLPLFFSYLETIFNGYGVAGGGQGGIVVFVTITVIVLVLIALVWFMSCFVAGYVAYKDKFNYNLQIALFLLLISFAAFAQADAMAANVCLFLSEQIATEADMIALIQSGKTGKLYVDKYPEAYNRIFGGINRSYFNGEDLAKKRNATVIVEADNDSRCFQGMGFLYLQISDKDAIYTNDEGVIDLLQNQGYVLKGYNDYKFELDLYALAAQNGVPIDENGIVYLDGPEHQLLYGPYIDIYDGKFTATFDLSIANEPYTDDYRICTLNISSYYGEKVLASAEIYRSSFDEEGKLQFPLAFNGYGQSYEFKILMDEGQYCAVSSISYSKTPAYDVHIKVDNEGRTIHKEYYDLEGNPFQMSGEYYGQDFAYDDNDNCIMTRYLGSESEPIIIESGYSEVRREFNNNKQMTRESYYDVDGEKILIPSGYSAYEADYDFAGNVIEYRYYGVDDKLTLLTKGYAISRRFFDENNRLIREEYYDDNDKAVLLTSGYSSYEKEYDEEGNTICVRYYGTEGEPVLLNNAYFMVTYEYNENRQNILEKYYGIDEQPILQASGQAGIAREYDAAGNVIKLTYLGLDGNPVTNTSGYATWRRSYDSHKWVIREEYYDVNENPVVLTQGQAAYEKEYDDKGNAVVTRYYGINNEPVIYNGAYHEIRIEYNDNKQSVREEYYGIDGNRIVIKDGYAGVTKEYDEAGNVIKQTYLGLDGNPTMNSSGYVTWKRAYDEHKWVIREEYYDENDNPITLAQGQAICEKEYDENGNVIVYRYYGVDNEPILYNGVYHYVTVKYNDQKQNIAEMYYGTDGNQIVTNGGYAGLSREYDDAGNVVKMGYLGLDGTPVINTSGYAFWKRSYNDRKFVTREEYYDTNEKRVSLAAGHWSVVYDYDDNGNRVGMRFYDAENNPVLYNGEYFYVKIIFDENNQKVEEIHYNIEDGLAELESQIGLEAAMHPVTVDGDTGFEAEEIAQNVENEELEDTEGDNAENGDEAESEDEIVEQEDSDENTDSDIPAGVSGGDYKIYDPNAKYNSVSEMVTPVNGMVNLRSIPGLDEPSEVVAKLGSGKTILRTAIGENGWSKLELEGRTVYAVTEYLKIAGEDEDTEDDNTADVTENRNAEADSEQADEQSAQAASEQSAEHTQTRATDPTAYSMSWGKDNKSCTIWSSGKLQGTMTVTDGDGNAKSLTNYGNYYVGTGKNSKRYLYISAPQGESALTINADSGFMECLKIMGYSGVYLNKQVYNW